jgi:Co/Zn/Cd efflux system component
VNLAGLCFTNDTSGQNAFLRSICLHVLVETPGSVAVTFSSICIVKFGFLICDAICSCLISVLIFVTTIPLLKKVVGYSMSKAADDIPVSELKQFRCVYELKSWRVRVATAKIERYWSIEGIGCRFDGICDDLRNEDFEDFPIETVV